MSRRNLPPYRRVHRVMRWTGNTMTGVCRHRWERLAWWCAAFRARCAPAGVHYVIRPAVRA